jgi:hypothetical protein
MCSSDAATSSPTTAKAPPRRAFSCAEGDSNLHPVIPDQALNLARESVDPSKSCRNVQIVRVAWTIWTHQTIWMLPRMLPRPSAFELLSLVD